MNFSITSRLSQDAYIKIMFTGLYKKPSFIIATIFGFFLLISVVLDYFHVINYYSSTPFFETFCGLFLILSPSLVVLISVNQFKSNPSFKNDMIYTFNEDGFRVDGTTFKSEISWAHIIKQKEIAGYVILYHTKKFGNFVDKSKLTNDQLKFIKWKVNAK